MDDVCTGPVLPAEAARVVLVLRQLAERSRDNGQASFHFVFATTADSLADNIENVLEWEAESDD